MTPANRRHDGRHRQGLPTTATVPRRRFDAAEVATAAQLTMAEPGWLIIYGKYARRYFGIPCLTGVNGPVEATDPDDLQAAMRAAEVLREVSP
jgi:hypothetical protein